MTAFQCKKCGACCRQIGFVYLEEGEAERLAGELGMGLYDFTDRYCRVLEKRHLVLQKHGDETCVFLEPGSCKVYEARPKQCRDFPGEWNTPNSRKYCEALKGG